MLRIASFNRNEKESITSPPGSAFEELELFELPDAVPKLGRFLELELFRGLLHLFREPLHLALELLRASEERRLLRPPPFRAGAALARRPHAAADGLHDRFRGDPVLPVVVFLD